MRSHQVKIHLPPKLHAAALKGAGDTPLAAWIRSLVERETGVSGEVAMGFASMSDRRLRAVSRKGARARHGKDV